VPRVQLWLRPELQGLRGVRRRHVQPTRVRPAAVQLHELEHAGRRRLRVRPVPGGLVPAVYQPERLPNLWDRAVSAQPGRHDLLLVPPGLLHQRDGRDHGGRVRRVRGGLLRRVGNRVCELPQRDLRVLPRRHRVPQLLLVLR
jgi:hypothetical protein